jgi:hypothetical protein
MSCCGVFIMSHELTSSSGRLPREPRPITGRFVLIAFIAFFGVIAAVNGVMMTYAITVTACPSLAVPCGLTAGGLPVGMQLIGPPRSEHRLLAAGAWLEQQFGLHERVPLLPQIRL